jgi:hypothetical protein
MQHQHHSNWVAVLVCAASLTCCLSSNAADELFFHYSAREGDTLIGLGQSMLRQPNDWTVLAQINRIRNPRQIPVGTELRIPLNLLRSSASTGIIVKPVGEVHLALANGQDIQVAENTPVPLGSTLQTGPQGWVTVALADGSVLRLAPSTKATLERSRHYVGAGFFASTLALIRGRIEALVAHVKGGEPRFEIKTPQAQLGVRGTSFRATVDEAQGATLSEILTGAVAVGSIRTKVDAGPIVGAGFGTRVTPDTITPQAVPLLPAPDLSPIQALHERPLVRMSVPVQAGAKAWRGQVASDADFRQVAAESTSSTGELRFAGLPDGPYYLRVRAADAQGLEGMDATTTFKLKARPEPPLPSTPTPKAKLRATEVALSWAQQEEAGRYHLQLALASAPNAPVVDDAHVTGSTRTQALPPGDYTWRLASIRRDGDRGPWGDPQTFVLRPPPAEPPPPKITPTTLQFAWATEEGQRFEFQVAKDRGFAEGTQTFQLSSPEATVAKPKTGGKLYIRYRAIDADGFIGPYTSPQLIDLPVCAQDRYGECIGTRTGDPLGSR